MSTPVNQIEIKSKQLQEELQKQSSYLTEINSAIKKLRHDRKLTIANINKIDGAIQAYNESKRVIGEANDNINSIETING